jgi:hypothetical protein
VYKSVTKAIGGCRGARFMSVGKPVESGERRMARRAFPGVEQEPAKLSRAIWGDVEIDACRGRNRRIARSAGFSRLLAAFVHSPDDGATA